MTHEADTVAPSAVPLSTEPVASAEGAASVPVAGAASDGELASAPSASSPGLEEPALSPVLEPVPPASADAAAPPLEEPHPMSNEAAERKQPSVTFARRTVREAVMGHPRMRLGEKCTRRGPLSTQVASPAAPDMRIQGQDWAHATTACEQAACAP